MTDYVNAQAPDVIYTCVYIFFYNKKCHILCIIRNRALIFIMRKIYVTSGACGKMSWWWGWGRGGGDYTAEPYVEIVYRHFRTQQLNSTKRFLKINSSEVLRFKLHWYIQFIKKHLISEQYEEKKITFKKWINLGIQNIKLR